MSVDVESSGLEERWEAGQERAGPAKHASGDPFQPTSSLCPEICGPRGSERAIGVASRLADLTQQHSSTLRQLFTLRLQQLVLRKQQVTALKGLILVQVDVLGEEAAVLTAV